MNQLVNHSFCIASSCPDSETADGSSMPTDLGWLYIGCKTCGEIRVGYKFGFNVLFPYAIKSKKNDKFRIEIGIAISKLGDCFTCAALLSLAASAHLLSATCWLLVCCTL
jgi:hypothetical protein